MYQVIKMYGDNEPWWFFDDWQTDIQDEVQFADFAAAQAYYQELWHELRQQYSCMNARKNFLCAFWEPEDQRWCEECDDDLQQYIGLALLKNYQAVKEESGEEFYETANSRGKTKCCQGFKQGPGCQRKTQELL